jgi:hypothetical protein
VTTGFRFRAALPGALIALALFVWFASPAAAIWVPQTRAEFTKAVSEGAKGAKMETFVVERGFDEVYRTLESRCTPCLDKLVERVANVGYVERSSSDYNPDLKRFGKDRAEFTLQVVNRPRGVGAVPPPGGLYVMAVDLKRAGANRTEVVLYRPVMGFKNISKSLMEWAEGTSTDCPKLK